MGEVIVRTCCGRPRGAPGNESVLIEPAGRPPVLAVGRELDRFDASELAQPDPAVAAHEAGHAIVHMALGGIAAGLRMRPNPIFQPADHLEGDAEIVELLAGRVAQAWFTRWQADLHPDGLVENIARVHQTIGGWCDECRALRNLIARHRAKGDDFIRNEYRRLEAITNTIVRRPDIWRAIRQTADEIMVDGTLDGRRVHQIADVHLDSEARASIRRLMEGN
ncbi:MAG: hypothetical protein JNM13_04915 [Hyphomicrobiaceae bacterium]|nr:hypothetical protein [Hyphomicrobiaceae bacterium]